MEIKELDWSKCRYSPVAKQFTNTISKAIPAFAEYTYKNRKQVFQYIVALYDKESPLWYKEPEYFPRKRLAITITELAEFTNSGDLNKTTREILEGRFKGVNQLVTAYLANMGDVEYTMLINELALYYSYTLRIITLDKSEYATLQELAENIKKRTREIFGSGEDDEIKRIKILLYESAEQDRQKLNPEAVIKALEKEGDFPPDWCRYGSGYNVGELKWKPNDS